MKVTKSGKRFSKRTSYEFETTQEVIDHLRKIARPKAEGGYSIGGSFAARLEAMRESAARFLESKGLPSAPVVWMSPNTSGVRTDFPVPEDQIIGGFQLYDIRIYVEKVAKCEDDSPEHLCARIISLIHQINGGSGEHRDLAILELGEVRTLAKVYGIDSKAHSDAAKGRWGDPEEIKERIKSGDLASVLAKAKSEGLQRQVFTNYLIGSVKQKYRKGVEIRGKAVYRDAVRAGGAESYTVDDAWNDLIGLAEMAGFNPVEHWDEKNKDKSTISYEGDKGRPLTLKTFRNRLSQEDPT